VRRDPSFLARCPARARLGVAAVHLRRLKIPPSSTPQSLPNHSQHHRSAVVSRPWHYGFTACTVRLHRAAAEDTLCFLGRRVRQSMQPLDVCWHNCMGHFAM